ncbi:VWA domain-containing protein [Candidatus Sumerlaeota bacterium]|nr:VWA domain-containing protein [Candidatus Sumerlaeota bacterium]
MIRFAEPWWFLLFLLIPPIIILRLRLRQRTPRMRFSSTAIVGKPSRSFRIMMRPLPTIFLFASLILLVTALARPQSPWREHKRKTEGLSIMLVMDVSESMRALDFKPNRMEKSKEVVKEFVRGRSDDLIGMVIFGKETFTLCPLTLDYAAVETFIDRINFDLVDGNATAIGMGLANAVNKLKDAATKSKVVILLTDGENNFGEIQPVTAAELAKKLGIRVYTIGVGSKGIVEIPMTNPFGGTSIGSIRSNIDTATLSKIADMTGGKFFEATDGEKLAQIYAQIDKMERTAIESNENNYFDERVTLFLIPALLLFGGAYLLEQTWLWSFP